VEHLAGIDAMLSSYHGDRFSGLQGLFDHLAPLLPRIDIAVWTATRRHSAEQELCHGALDCCYAFLVTLNEHLDRADAAMRAAWEAIEGPFTIKDTRSQLFLAYASIALEHQEAITLLIRRGLRGSAVALIRPVFEIFYRAAWIHHCAKPNQIEKIKKGKFRFPPMGAMVTGIDNAMGQTFFQNFKSNSWKDQNDFTHSGRMQVNSRLTRDDLQSAYPDEMIAANLATTTMVAILVTVILLKTHGRVTEGERLEAMMAQFELKRPSRPSSQKRTRQGPQQPKSEPSISRSRRISKA
jgi:uncharacterized protein DUF6988